MEGVVELPVIVGRAPIEVIVSLGFLVVHTSSSYNAIQGRPRLNTLRAIVSTYHLLVKFPTRAGVEEIRGDQLLAWQCYLATIKRKKSIKILNVEAMDTRDEQELC